MAEGAYTEDQQEEKVVQIRRVTKVVKGGKKFGFRAVVVVGDRRGKVGLGVGKSNEVSSAIRKAVDHAKKHMVDIQLADNTIAHPVRYKFGASRVLLRPAPAGRGVIAGGAMRIVLELSGVRDVVGKALGSTNAINLAQATISALQSLYVFAQTQGTGEEVVA